MVLSTATRRRSVSMFYQYKLGRTLGEGQFGRVKEGWTGETKVAIKLLLKKKLLQDDTAESRLREEVECLERISHPNIIKIIEVLNDDTYVGIVTECMPNGDLFRYVNESSSGQPSENQARIWFSQLISAVSYLHDNGIAHRDIKLDNLLLDSKMNLVVADFGFAHSFNDNGNIRHPTATSGCGSPCYAAPEVVVPEPNYSARMADIWSCGVVLYCLLTGMLPWDDYKIRIANEDSNPTEYHRRNNTIDAMPDFNDVTGSNSSLFDPNASSITVFYDFIIRASLSFPEFINESACNLIQNILCIDPDTRFTMKDIKSHPWTRGRNMDVTQYLTNICTQSLAELDISTGDTKPLVIGDAKPQNSGMNTFEPKSVKSKARKEVKKTCEPAFSNISKSFPLSYPLASSASVSVSPDNVAISPDKSSLFHNHQGIKDGNFSNGISAELPSQPVHRPISVFIESDCLLDTPTEHGISGSISSGQQITDQGIYHHVLEELALPLKEIGNSCSSSINVTGELPSLQSYEISAKPCKTHDQQASSAKNDLVPIVVDNNTSDTLLFPKYRLWPLCRASSSYKLEDRPPCYANLSQAEEDSLFKQQRAERLADLSSLNVPVTGDTMNRYLNGEGLYPYRPKNPREVSNYVYGKDYMPPRLVNGIKSTRSHRTFSRVSTTLKRMVTPNMTRFESPFDLNFDADVYDNRANRDEYEIGKAVSEAEDDTLAENKERTERLDIGGKGTLFKLRKSHLSRSISTPIIPTNDPEVSGESIITNSDSDNIESNYCHENEFKYLSKRKFFSVLRKLAGRVGLMGA